MMTTDLWKKSKVCEKCGHEAVREYVRGDYFETKCFWCLNETSIKMFEKEKENERLLFTN